MVLAGNGTMGCHKPDVLERTELVATNKPMLIAALLVCLSFALRASVVADEGMWTLDHFPKAEVQSALGVEVTDAWLDRVMRSVVRLDGGCTGSFASPDGLVLTNNHCVWRCIARLSSSERNLSDEGFLAATREDEMVCPGEQISVLQATEEITSKIERAISGKDSEAANEARKWALGELERGCEEDSAGLHCESVALYNGGQYFLYKYKRYEDVRLVFAPELQIAAFGGDPDNFNFPRYSLDMSFLRVYEGGEPASVDHHLEWRPEGPESGEAVFVAGHPGTTQRLLTVRQLERQRNSVLPKSLLRTSELRGRLLEWAKTSEEAEQIVQQRILGIENGIKVRRNRLFALLDDNNMNNKRREEKELREAVAANRELKERYGDSWQAIEDAYRRFEPFAEQYNWVATGTAFNTRLFRYAQMIVRAAEERSKPSAERLPEFRETALPQLQAQLDAVIPIYPEYEQLNLSFSLEKMREWLGPDDPYVKKIMGKESPEALAGRLIEGTRLSDRSERVALWQGGKDAVEASDDAMIVFARAIDQDARDLRKRFETALQAPVARASERIAKARFAVQGTSRYPDATFSLRVSYGTVTGWPEKGVEVLPFTRLATLWDRTTGEDPFRVPQSWQDARKQLDNSTRFNLVANTDIIGGNSGSPMIDRDGRLVGLVFDGNIHSIAGAYFFDKEKNRTVAVHPAIMVEGLRKVYEAEGLLRELGLQ